MHSWYLLPRICVVSRGGVVSRVFFKRGTTVFIFSFLFQQGEGNKGNILHNIQRFIKMLSHDAGNPCKDGLHF